MAQSMDVMDPRFWAEDAIAVMDAVGCQQATIFTPSHSAMTGLVLAADYPERVRSLVIVNGTARMRGAPGLTEGGTLSERSIPSGRASVRGDLRPPRSQHVRGRLVGDVDQNAHLVTAEICPGKATSSLAMSPGKHGDIAFTAGGYSGG